MLIIKGSSEMGLFRHLSNHVFRSLVVQKYVSYEGHLLFENVENCILIVKMENKIQKIFLVSEIKASENIAINGLC